MKKIKKAILLEAKANLKFLQDVSNPKTEIKEERLIQIINNISIMFAMLNKMYYICMV
jgi:hypothetical protein